MNFLNPRDSTFNLLFPSLLPLSLCSSPDDFFHESLPGMNSSVYRLRFNPSYLIMPKGSLKREILLSLLSKFVIFSPLPSGKKKHSLICQKKTLMILSSTISSSCLMINPYLFFVISIIQNCILHSLSL